MAIINKPLNVFEIADLLGYYEYAPHPVTGQTVRKVDVGRLCTHANVNKWSKYKPIKKAGIEELSEADYIYHNYGIEIVSDLGENSNPKSLYDKVINLGYTHKYLKPIGGALSPFRVSDFNNYQHEGGLPPISTGVKSSPVKAFRYQPFLYGGVEPQPTEYLLSKLDLYPTAHRGILLVNITKNASYWTTGAVDWNNINLRTWADDDIRAMEFIVTNPESRLIRGDYNRFDTIGDPPNDFYAVMGESGSLNPYEIEYIYGSIPPMSIPYVSRLSGNYDTGRVFYTLTFDSTTPETKGGLLKNITIQLSLGGEVIGESLKGDFNLLNNRTQDFVGSFGAPNVAGLVLSAFEDGKLINKSNILIQQ